MISLIKGIKAKQIYQAMGKSDWPPINDELTGINQILWKAKLNSTT